MMVRDSIACGATYPDAETEARVQALRGQQGLRTDGGCGKALPWTYAYRCVECARWFHRTCILRHFSESPAAASGTEAE